MSGSSLFEATKQAMNTVRNMIAQNVDNVDKYKGSPIEICLEALNDEET